MKLRLQRPQDNDAIDALLALVYPSGQELALVRALRESGAPLISLVAEVDNEIVGFLVFSPVMLNKQLVKWYALGPEAVSPSCELDSVRQPLIEKGMHTCQSMGLEAVVTLGDLSDFEAFDFQLAEKIDCDMIKENDSLLIRHLIPPSGLSGKLDYHPAFKKYTESI